MSCECLEFDLNCFSWAKEGYLKFPQHQHGHRVDDLHHVRAMLLLVHSVNTHTGTVLVCRRAYIASANTGTSITGAAGCSIAEDESFCGVNPGDGK